MKTRVWRLYYDILANIPERYHRPVIMFRSEKSMLEYTGERTKQSYDKIKKYYKEVTEDEGYIEVDGLLPRKYQIKKTNSIVGLAFEDEILINCYGLRNESDNVVKYVILHELGHANDKRNYTIKSREREADKFALFWLS